MFKDRSHKLKVIILYEYFFPGYKAGGPVQSLVNLITALGDQYDFFVITTAYDLDDTNFYPGISVDSWNSVHIGGNEMQVWYDSSKRIRRQVIGNLIREIRPQVIFVSGLFTLLSTWPLILKRIGQLSEIRVIVSPRGMLQAGALRLKAKKKKLFLLILKFLNLNRGIIWHSTTPDETNDIRRIIGTNTIIKLAGNIPKKPFDKNLPLEKLAGKIDLVYLSLVTQKKNLLLILDVLKTIPYNVNLDIYGPVKDARYWKTCLETINVMPVNVQVRYCDSVQPELVQSTISRYHSLILLTSGENFGHALYECLSVGRPLITSNYTPWIDLERKQAGWNFEIERPEAISEGLKRIIEMDQSKFDLFCDGAWRLANNYYSAMDFREQYSALFYADNL